MEAAWGCKSETIQILHNNGCQFKFSFGITIPAFLGFKTLTSASMEAAWGFNLETYQGDCREEQRRAY